MEIKETMMKRFSLLLLIAITLSGCVSLDKPLAQAVNDYMATSGNALADDALADGALNGRALSQSEIEGIKAQTKKLNDTIQKALGN